MEGTCVKISGVRKVVARSHFKVFVYFLLKSQLLGIEGVDLKLVFVKPITEAPWAPAAWPALCQACWGCSGGGGQRAPP